MMVVVDEWVVVIVLIVIDMFNLVLFFEYYYVVYGFWVLVVGDYECEGIMDWMGIFEYDELFVVIEFFLYFDCFILLKMIINVFGDQFFFLDLWQFYWDEFEGEKYLCYVVNVDYFFDGLDVVVMFGVFYVFVVVGMQWLNYFWQQEGDIFVVQVDSENLLMLV